MKRNSRKRGDKKVRELEEEQDKENRREMGKAVVMRKGKEKVRKGKDYERL